jgi:hypothetical protein
MKIYDRSSSGSNLCLATVVVLYKAEGASPGDPPLGRRMQCESGIAYAVPRGGRRQRAVDTRGADPHTYEVHPEMDLTKEQVRQMFAELAFDTEDASSY